ncbi:hypothetical protein F2Q69_00031864 [Brassica cretica]|uniref:DNA-3-methyladenine glycosylase II n=1 Tax=Brassica cretica TaxID=69181 RepID=A0A8S9SAZ1_BRACR|nr:hypothetical protein F2Q69_00031864 [Brassica cretica]
MKTPPRRSKRVDRESEPPKVTTPVALRASREKKHCSKTRAVRVRPEYPLTRTPPEMKLMPPEFFQIDALDLAPRLLGKFLRRDNVVLRITEVEAYRPNDSACHGRSGVTPRTAPIFGPGGHAYVYLCYGLHMMLNVVADKDGVGAAVLIRSCSPVTGNILYSETLFITLLYYLRLKVFSMGCDGITGLETIQERRGQKTDKPLLLNGPGKVGQALGLSTEWSHHPLYSPGELEVLDGGEDVEKVLVGPRVGIDYALPEHVNALWRFAIADTPWISAPKNTLKPL